MNIKLHNYFEISYCGKVYKSYNEVLGDINLRFLSGENYTKYIVFGTGIYTDTAGITALNSYAGGKEAVIYGKNFDVTNGIIYLKKCIELDPDEYNGVLISEVALSPQQGGGNIINYANLYDEQGNLGILKNVGESLTITVTLYLNITETGTGNLCGGENPLMDILFGFKNINSCSLRAVFSDFYAGGSVKRFDINEYVTLPASFEFNSSELVISASLMQDTDYSEIILLIDEMPCIRLAAENYNNSEISENIEIQTEKGTAVANVCGITSVTGIKYGGVNVPYSASEICGGITDVIKNPLRFILKADDKMFFCGKFAALYGTDTLDIYNTENGTLKKLEFDFMNFSVYSINNILIDSQGNLYFFLNKSPYMSFSKYDNNILKTCTAIRQYDSSIISVGLSEYGGETHIFYYTYSGGIKTCSDYIVSYNGLLYNETLYKTYSQDNFTHFFDREADTEIFYNNSIGTFSVYPSALTISDNVKELLKSCTHAIINKNYILIQTGSKWRMLNLFTGGEVALYESSIRKIYAGADGKVIVKLYSNNKMSAAYVEGSSGRLIRFEIDKRISGEITDVRIIGQEGIIISAKTKNTDNYYLPADRKKILVYIADLIDNDTVINADILRNSFKNASGKTLKCCLKLT